MIGLQKMIGGLPRHCATLLLVLCLQALSVPAQEGGLNRHQFNRFWRIESEAPDYKVSFKGDTLDLVAPKGLTLWRREKMKGAVTIEYDACVVMENEGDRLSDLNCFWMAQDPLHPNDIFKRASWRKGIFVNCYSLKMYYLGFGGNHNTTTRFRRYDGDAGGIEDPARRPAILTEYTDEAHLLKPNHWYHVKIECRGNRVTYEIDGERLVDFRDAEPLNEGWFGFRTTLSHVRLANFRYLSQQQPTATAPLHWVGEPAENDLPVCFGVPFDEGEVTSGADMQLVADGNILMADTWPLAYWPDGSVKWLATAAVVPAGAENMMLRKSPRKTKGGTGSIEVNETSQAICVNTGKTVAYIPREGAWLVDSLVKNGVIVGEKMQLVCSAQDTILPENGGGQLRVKVYRSQLEKAEVERVGQHSAVVKLTGWHADGVRRWLPFTVRLTFHGGSDEMKMVHSFVFDGDEHHDFVRSLGVTLNVPLRDELYNRHVAFSCADGGLWSEPVQPLDGRRELFEGEQRPARPRPDESLPEDNQPGQLSLQQQQMLGMRIPGREAFNRQNQVLLDEWAAWDSYRLSQLSADGFTIRKRANADNPWIGTFSGTRSSGFAFAGDLSGGMYVGLKDFWQSFPSSIQVDHAKTEAATLTVWLWSPEAEPMDLRHYDNVAHGLNSSYEDVQPGMSSPQGIARTSTLFFRAADGYQGKPVTAANGKWLLHNTLVMPTPQYLHDKQAFGIWSLPDRSNAMREKVEDYLDQLIDYYQKQIEQHRWYGFWNYGDVMHAYDAERHSWRYDVGGFAWDNTELASNSWLWYSFLRTGRSDIWTMAEAMTRHTTEVDVYHQGPNAMLGSRHNVSHWGCGAKEARISQAVWNRFYYYLTADERTGDLMTEVRDADQKLYELDPMRLAQPRGQFPCTAPARLRIGPDWLAYAGNWMTEWERTGNVSYRDKIVAGMTSIAALPHQLFTGPLALGYDPATGIITTECDTSLLSTNHLMTIMGGFEIMNEMMRMIHLPQWNAAWLDHAARYKAMAQKVRNNHFRVSRLLAYAAYKKRSNAMAREAWTDLLKAMGSGKDPQRQMRTIMPPEVPARQDEIQMMSTNHAATWALDAIYMQEVIPIPDNDIVF